jgi:hypothetical protein
LGLLCVLRRHGSVPLLVRYALKGFFFFFCIASVVPLIQVVLFFV